MNIKILTVSAALLFGSATLLAQENNDSTALIEPGVIYVDHLLECSMPPKGLPTGSERCCSLGDNVCNGLSV